MFGKAPPILSDEKSKPWRPKENESCNASAMSEPPSKCWWPKEAANEPSSTEDKPKVSRAEATGCSVAKNCSKYSKEAGHGRLKSLASHNLGNLNVDSSVGRDSSKLRQSTDEPCQKSKGDFATSTPAKDWMKEKCRDPWRPTEMESNICNLNVCPGDAHQDTSTKRRTGASCQALRHAVASLNRLDDFYMEKIGAGFFSEVFKLSWYGIGIRCETRVDVYRCGCLLRGYSQSDESGDGPEDEPAAREQTEHVERGPADEQAQPSKHTQNWNYKIGIGLSGGKDRIEINFWLIRFMGVCVHEGQLHALTEYINGGSLEQLIIRGLFHRDLTSKNVLIKKDENTFEMTAVVGDFGLAAKIPDPSSGYRLSTVGIVCELIGRVPADPDVLPRSDNFGLDYLAVAEICAAADPPPAFLQLAFNCCTYEPKSRPTFPEITSSLETMITNYEESKNNIGKRQSVDPSLMSSMDEITREGRSTKRKTARLRSQSADARGCDNATPSDKARCHSARRVAELASRRDPHYRPMTANPFHALGGVKKILGDLFSSCLELPSLEDVRPSVTDAIAKFKPAQNDSIAKILDRKKPNSEPSSPTARKKWERKVATKVGAASLFMHPLFRDGWEPRRRGSCESGFWSCVGEDLSPEPPNRRHTSTLSSSAASSLFLLDDHRTSSIYTDSSEDIASLGGGDSCWEDRLSGIGSSSKTISKIVEYFEKKQAGSLRLTDYDAGSSRLTLLKASLEGPVPLCNISAAQRLVVCEGAVRSKLSLFDKK
ncbi:Dual specificity testis-specific protein kinase [Apis cerana cerana]|uniref:Dual specificity testis-specific protein kinase n=1 Tax=Apis cerana cerana TaxID=94128 RepID=A0A2A3EKS4_APICC|nr:Dual specificity testis-specific protein kinase [Apis cerana cerana]